MKLSDLASYKQGVDALTLDPITNAVGRELALVTTDLHRLSGATTQRFSAARDAVETSLNAAKSALAAAKEELQLEFERLSRNYFRQSEDRYEREKTYDSPEFVEMRKMAIAADALETARSRVLLYADWQYCALQLRPYQSDFTNLLVSCDPLYLVDQNPELLSLAITQFSADYQRRICCYSYNEHEPKFLTGLPDGQFGLVVAVNYFEFMSFEVVKQLLEEFWVKLKPGGTVVMTVNDCDRPTAVKHAEAGYAAFTPGTLVKGYADRLGYEFIFSFAITNSSTWYEFKKPGTTSTLRGGQSLAKIVDR